MLIFQSTLVGTIIGGLVGAAHNLFAWVGLGLSCGLYWPESCITEASPMEETLVILALYSPVPGAIGGFIGGLLAQRGNDRKAAFWNGVIGGLIATFFSILPFYISWNLVMR